MTQNSSKRARAGLIPKFVRVGLAALLLMIPASARSATITQSSTAKHRVPASRSPGIHIQGQEVADLQAFLAGGPVLWAKEAPPKFPFGLVLANRDGTLRDTTVNQFLWWMRSHNIARFDHRHPIVAPLFQQYDKVAASAQTLQIARTIGRVSQSAGFQILIPPTTAGSTASETGTTGAPVVRAQVFAEPVPEPGSVASTLVLFGASGYWWLRRRRSASA